MSIISSAPRGTNKPGDDDAPFLRRTVLRSLAASMTLALVLALASPGTATAQPGPADTRAGSSAVAAVTSALRVSAASWQGSYGAGQNKPFYNDGAAKSWYTCVGDKTIFKITQASIYMWSRGEDRIKGFQFKYRLVAKGTEGQPQWYSNWSKNTSVSFKKNKKIGRWMNAAALGQSFSSTAEWDMEIKLKYARSLRTAFRAKYRMHMGSPQCGVLTGSP